MDLAAALPIGLAGAGIGARWAPEEERRRIGFQPASGSSAVIYVDFGVVEAGAYIGKVGRDSVAVSALATFLAQTRIPACIGRCRPGLPYLLEMLHTDKCARELTKT